MKNKGKLIEKVYKADLNQRATLVIFYLINRANMENSCFPSIKTIAKECNISTRTVHRALNDLEKADFLIRENRFHEQGGQRSNLYHLLSEESTEEYSCNSTITADTTKEINQYICDKPMFMKVQAENIQIKLHKEDIKVIYGFKHINFNSYHTRKISHNALSGTLCHNVIP